jgi:hypothetical protein
VEVAIVELGGDDPQVGVSLGRGRPLGAVAGDQGEAN